MVMWGENDREVPLRDGEKIHQEIPGSRLIVFRECGHIPHEEYPERFTEMVSDFLRK
jgi:pimeloyl-ACP methyl ester carboxylesterase